MPKLAAAKEDGPKLAAAKSYTLASLTPGKTTAVIKDGKIKIMAAEKGKKPARNQGRRKGSQAGGQDAAKPQPRSPPRFQPRPRVAAKPAAKPAAKSKQATGKRVKLAAAR